MDHRFVALQVTDEKKDAVEVFRKYDRTALPVVDAHGALAGIVTIDDVLDVAEEEATKEIQRFGGLEALDEALRGHAVLRPGQEAGLLAHRAFPGRNAHRDRRWGSTSRRLRRPSCLALFIPLIISSGGNSGSQAATLIIRAWPCGEVKLRDWWMVMRRSLPPA